MHPERSESWPSARALARSYQRAFTDSSEYHHRQLPRPTARCPGRWCQAAG